MAAKPTCLVCQKEMELGFMTDSAHGFTINLPRWCRGTPKKGGWLMRSEVKPAQAEAGIPVVAYRCPECEALRLYAPTTPPASAQ